MIITTSNWPKLLYPGLRLIYGDTYKEHEVQYKNLFDETTSERAYEEFLGSTNFGLAAIKTEGNSIQYDSDNQGFLSRIAPFVYAKGFIITREAVEDDLYGMVGNRRAKKLARAIRQTQEVVHANVYNRAFSSTYTGGDGSALLAGDHPWFNGGTYSNLLSTPADFSEAALEQATIDIMNWEDDRGNKINVKPKSLILPTNLVYEKERILKTPYRVGVADNDINALHSMGIFSNCHINNYLTNQKAWFIRTDIEDGMISVLRRGMEFDVDNDFDTENAKYKATIRFAPGWADPHGLFGSQGIS